MRVSPCTQPKHLKCAALRGIVSSRVIAQPGHCNRYGKNITTRTSPAAAASTTATTTTTPSNVFTQEDMDAFVTGYTSIFTENTLPITPELVSGTIPAELSGTYVRNIPGLLEIGGVKIPQPFDGDGMVAAVTFHEGRALFRNKYVRTEALIKEQAAGRMLYQGVFNKVGSEDTLFNNPFTLEVKKPANTSVAVWNDRLFALYEADLPHELDPATLQTIGRVSITPATDNLLPIIAAHWRIVRQTDGSRRWVCFAAKEKGLDSRLVFQEVGEDGTMLQAREVLLKGAAFGLFHDVMVTENFYIVIENSIRLDVVQLLTGYVPKRASFAQCLQYRPDIPCKMHLIPRDPAAPVESYTLPNSFFCFHHWNAYEAGNQVVVDTCAFLDGIDFSASLDTVDPKYYNKNKVGRATALRIVLNRTTGQVEQRKLFTRATEFPMIHPEYTGRRHSVGFSAGADIDHPDYWTPPQSIIKHTICGDEADPAAPSSVIVDVYNPGRGRYCQEPVIVPKAAGEEEDVWVLAYVYDTQRRATDLEILDGKALSQGPVACIRLPLTMPFGLHGCWSSKILGPLPKEVTEASVYDIRNGVADKQGVAVYE